jgi:hypothetical protein
MRTNDYSKVLATKEALAYPAAHDNPTGVRDESPWSIEVVKETPDFQTEVVISSDTHG